VPAVWALDRAANAITTARATALIRNDIRLGRIFADLVRIDSKKLLSALPEKMGGVRRLEMALRTSKITAIDLRIECDCTCEFWICGGTTLPERSK